ncbi:MAG: ribonuclease H [Cyanobacteriota bacterium]|nr:ribonuclease H [Cyanobacteriota bacterium]
MAKESRVVLAACDGACSGNPGPGGWGALLKFEDGAVKEMGGYAPATTNNRMELTAALELMRALEDLPRHPDLVILTDSRYLVDGLGKWIGGWKRKGWRTASGGPVLNRDLWEELDQARVAGVGLQHVRGHSGHPENDRCDAIAVAYSKGGSPTLASPEQAPKAPKAAPAGKAATAAEAPPESSLADPAPKGLVQLLSRLELADRLAAGGYGLTAVELAGLVEKPLNQLAQLEAKKEPWRWRDWLVEPAGDGRWRLRRGEGG